MSEPSMSSTVANSPDGGLTHHLPRLFAHANNPSMFSPSKADSRVGAIEVGGITATVGIGRPFAAVSSRMARARSSIVNSVVRPGIHPSAYSAASRADLGVAPQYQNGMDSAGLGSIVMFSKEYTSSA